MLRNDSSRFSRFAVTAAVAAVITAACTTSAGAQNEVARRAGPADVLMGSVTDTAGRPIGGATIIITQAPDRRVLSDTSNSNGRFEIQFQPGTGDYLVHVSAAGMAAARRRVQAVRIDSASPLRINADFILRPQDNRLETIDVQAEHVSVNRGLEHSTGVGADERITDQVVGAVNPISQGSIASSLFLTPGATVADGGISALGLSPAQTSVTLDGMAFAGNALPPDARVRSRFTTATYDATRGGFSGAEIALELAPGGSYRENHARFAVDPAALHVTDRIGRELGSAEGGIRGSAGGDGEIIRDKWFYNFGIQGARRTTDAVSLEDKPLTRLPALGVAPDSAIRFVSIARQLGLPFRSSQPQRLSDDAAAVLRIDRTPDAPSSFSSTLALEGSSVRNANASLFSTSSHLNASSQVSGQLQAAYARSSDAGALNETRVAISRSSETSRPEDSSPEAIVAIANGPVASTLGGSVVSAGGSSGRSDKQSTSFEAVDEFQKLVAAGRGKVKFAVRGSFATTRRLEAAGVNGRFTFSSLADFANGSPSTYLRTVAAPTSATKTWNGSAAASEFLRLTPALEVVFGARLDIFHVGLDSDIPLEASQLPTARTNHSPAGATFSPRIGATWAYGRGNREGTSISPLGRFVTLPAGLLRGGIGAFANYASADELSAAVIGSSPRNTIECLGSAAPQPDWNAYETGIAAPSTCLEGASGILADTALNGVFLARNWRPPVSWRGNLGWYTALHGWKVSLDGIVSLNRHQPSIAPLNLISNSAFSLNSEAGRPIFAPAAAIDTATGIVSPVASRANRDVGDLTVLGSDGRSVSRRLTVGLVPALGGASRLSLSYTWSATTARLNGFTGTTAGDPRNSFLAPSGLDIRHQILGQAGWVSPRGWAASLTARISSGRPFTPLVGGDINGDGRLNDRPFIFASQSEIPSDENLGREIAAAARNAPAGIRSCISQAAGRIISHNECRLPWTAELNAHISLPGTYLKIGHRTTIGLTIVNLGDGIAQLLGGSPHNLPLGFSAARDPVLLIPTGYDQAAGRFAYSVNSHFGQTLNPALARFPMRIALDVRVGLGSPVDAQALARSLEPGRNGGQGTRLTAEALSKRYARSVSNVYRAILAQSDSLLLEPTQVDSLIAANVVYTARVELIWRQLGSYLAALPDHYNSVVALQRVDSATTAAWAVAQEQGPIVKRILSPPQVSLLPAIPAMIVNATGPIMLRIYP